jgi:hypothetical protein
MATLYQPDTATNPTTVTTAAAFIKELWSDEVIAVYKANTVMVPLVQSMPFSGQKGDTVHIPKPSRGVVHSGSRFDACVLHGRRWLCPRSVPRQRPAHGSREVCQR